MEMRLPIVLDTCTILNLLRIDEDEFLYKKLVKLKINICQTVFEEAQRNIRIKTFPENQRKYISSHTPQLVRFIIKCDEQFEKEYKACIQEFCDYKKENGEFYSTLVSLYVCRKEKCRSYFYTDDYRAKSTFESFFNYQQIGVIGDTVDLLIFLYWTNTDFKQKQLENYLSNLFQEFAIPFREFKDQFMRKKEAWVNSDIRNRKLKENLDKIEIGLQNLEFEMIESGMNYFKNDVRSYREINAFLDNYSNIDFSGYIISKIKKTRRRLQQHPIYKLHAKI